MLHGRDGRATAAQTFYKTAALVMAEQKLTALAGHQQAAVTQLDGARQR
ncbi:hypothetical protein [Pseudomonas sp. CCC3.1]